MTGLEILGTLFKPVYSAFQIIHGLFTAKKNGGGFRVPRKTLILLPSNSYPMHWGIAMNGDVELMQISGSLQATNIAECAIRPSDIQVLWPRYTEAETKLLMVEGDDGMHSSRNMIPRGAIGHISFTLILKPVWGKRGERLVAKLAVLDQFGNSHKIKLECRYMGPPL
ncbi:MULTISPECIES: hypothetical protein [unclassified Bradyrhizobium]|uniref:hypothetical protein n=1 Tax=unclassified Bradyrhizobium TaxID=2631580 RepID=UPI002916BC75|nr:MULTISPECIES: hypothetical protein [unclassified Bradyrhizobium]